MKPRWEILSILCNKINAKVVAEIGVNRGINAANWLNTCPELERMYLVDPVNAIFDIGLFQDLNVDKKIVTLWEESKDAANILPDNLDLVFIDAQHGYEEVKKDIELWLPKVRKGGIICGHDYTLQDNPHTEVTKAVAEKFKFYALEQDELENGNIYIWWTIV